MFFARMSVFRSRRGRRMHGKWCKSCQESLMLILNRVLVDTNPFGSWKVKSRTTISKRSMTKRQPSSISPIDLINGRPTTTCRLLERKSSLQMILGTLSRLFGVVYALTLYRLLGLFIWAIDQDDDENRALAAVLCDQTVVDPEDCVNSLGKFNKINGVRNDESDGWEEVTGGKCHMSGMSSQTKMLRQGFI